MNRLYKKHLITVAKVLISGGTIFWVFSKISVNDIFTVLQTVQLSWFFISVLLYFASKVVAAIRFNLMLECINSKLPFWENMKLYWIGMFYNNFLPGGVGGDGYKSIIIHKRFKTGYKRSVSALLVDRLSGLIIVFAMISILVAISESWFNMQWLFVFLSPLIIFLFWLITKYSFKTFYPKFFKTTLLSGGVQLLQLLEVLALLKSFGIDENIIEYLLLFFVSSIAAALPITIGGIGAREIVFLEGSTFIGIESSIAISIGVLVYLTALICSLCGIFFSIDINKKKIEPHE